MCLIAMRRGRERPPKMQATFLSLNILLVLGASVTINHASERALRIRWSFSVSLKLPPVFEALRGVLDREYEIQRVIDMPNIGVTCI